MSLLMDIVGQMIADIVILILLASTPIVRIVLDLYLWRHNDGYPVHL